MEASEEAHICPRRELNDLAPLRPEVLHCYGVDFLSNKEVLEVFDPWKPQQVEWLDDSSCNLIFGSEDSVQKVIQTLAVGDANGPWTRTGPLSVASKDNKKGKARSRGLKKFCLQLRIATEADRKDPTHSGHTDSVYYMHVKEQQAMQKQAEELRRMKKRQRQMTPRHKDGDSQKASGDPSPEASQNAQASTAASCSEHVDASKKVLPGGSILSTRLASCGLLDPLLFLKAPAGNNLQGASNAAQPEDLKTSLKRAEAEYAAVLHPLNKAPAAMAKASADRGRAQRVAEKREGTPGRFGGRDATPGRTGQQRGKKRRPVEQEPRPVSEASPPQRKAELFPEVEAFLKKHDVKCNRHVLQRSFRSIKYAQQEALKTKAMAQKQSEKIQEKGAKSEAEPASAWDQYMKANKSFTSHGIFMQTVAWKVEGRRVLSVVTHPLMTDVEKVAKAVQKPIAAVQQCKLKDISQETGFPVFVCPPFGYPPDSDGQPPLLLVDSSIADLKKPLLFDCGATGLSLPVSEFLRSTRAICIENLAKAKVGLNSQAIGLPANPPALSLSGDVKNSIISPASNGAASPEPAPEPAPITADRSDFMEQ
eukprot:symbB.v1.2.026737.t2/scaffold2694.1/size91562/13